MAKFFNDEACEADFTGSLLGGGAAIIVTVVTLTGAVIGAFSGAGLENCKHQKEVSTLSLVPR